MNRTILVTGTDTGVGKTIFAAGLTAALSGRYWKPIQAGLDEEGDRATVIRLAKLDEQRAPLEAYRLATPCSPHRAAEIDRVEIDPQRLALPAGDGPLVVEGAGGALVPVTRNLLFADLFRQWRASAVIVARTSLGTINHSLMTLEALRSRDVPVLGIAFVGEPNEDSEATIAEIGAVRRLGRLPLLDPLTPRSLQAAFAANFDSEGFRA